MDGDRFYFLAKDPHWTFLWWDIKRENLEQVKALLGERAGSAKFTLRLHDITGVRFDGSNSNTFYDIEVVGTPDNWYLDVPVAHRTYCVEAGFKTREGDFFPVACSNPLSVPRDCDSEYGEEKWSTTTL